MAFLLALSLVCGRARAETSADAEATRLFKAAVAEFKAEEWDRASSLFVRSYAQAARAATICNLALTYDKWTGHDADAQEAYRKCAEDDQSGHFRDHALERAKMLREKLERAPKPAPRAKEAARPSVKVESAEPVATTSPPRSASPQPATRAGDDERQPPAREPQERASTKPSAPESRLHEPAVAGLTAATVVVGVITLGVLAVGIGLEVDANFAAAYLSGKYGNNSSIPPGATDDTARYDQAKREAADGTSVYYATAGIAGVTAVLAITDVIVAAVTRPDAPRTASTSRPRFAVAPVNGGAVMQGLVRF